MRQELESRVSTNSSLGVEGAEAKVVALVGPPGAGKTTTLVKLAARFGLAARKPIQILSMDTHRIAAAEQLRCYASILGVGFQVLETPRAVSQCIEEHRNKELILIDTPGFGPSDIELQADLTALLADQSDIDVHLVLPATMKSEDLARTTDRFRAVGAAKIIFTQLDVTDSLGSALNESIRSRLPVSFFCVGQQIPEDIEAAAPDRLLEAVFPTQLGAVAAA
jgi:flagellar biosynthesis protein FlhF